MIFKALIIAIFSILSVQSSKILIVFPTLSKSHVIPLQTLAKSLAEKNHEITFVSAFPLGKQVKNYRDIKVPFREQDMDFINEISKSGKSVSPLVMMQYLPSMVYRTGNETLQMKEMRKLMDEEKFDLLIVGYFMTEFVLGLGDHFKCPTIVFSPAGAVSTLYGMVGNPLSPSSAPHFVAQSLNLESFGARLKNFFANAVDLLVVKQVFKYMGKQVYNFNFPAERGYRSYEESIKNVSLVMLNTHFSSTKARPYLPNMIEVGGLQVKPKPSPLPEDLKKFLDDAKDGAIFFSLGSNAKSTFLPQKIVDVLLKTFSQIKQRVVMKWESDTMEGKPDNVFIGKWLPQDDILSHPNVKIFISHCGYGGLIESKYHGVPIIGMPFFGDQLSNADLIEKEGWGKQISLSTITESELKSVIAEIVGNPRFAATAKRLSSLAQDRPLNAQETAVYWVEYILRHNGAPHLHFQAADLNFFQDNSLDVIGFLIFAVYIALKLIGFIFKKICCSGSAQKKQKVQ